MAKSGKSVIKGARQALASLRADHETEQPGPELVIGIAGEDIAAGDPVGLCQIIGGQYKGLYTVKKIRL